MARDLKLYEVYIKVTVVGEDEEDALEYVDHAIDVSDLIGQDGIKSVELTDDIECIENDNYEENDEPDFDTEEFGF
jgi:hypothetical protein